MNIDNIFQAKYAAAELSQRHRIGKLQKLIPLYMRAGLEVFPHQNVAAANALNNPFGKGYILADEVGLGKAIEATLVIAQTYYDGLKYIAVIVPKQQVRQWSQLLAERFGLPFEELSVSSFQLSEDSGQLSVVSYQNKDKVNSENSRILKTDNCKLILTTYETAAALSDSLKETPWDLVVFDEAHRFRKFRQANSKMAEALYGIFKDTRKLLLTATPMQGNVMDLWSMIAFIDDGLFPDADEFYKRYHKKPDNYPELKELLAPYIFRTLRGQVKADVLLTERYIHTELYKLSEPEKRIYTRLENYLSRAEKIAFPEMDGYELNLMMFKLFSSSIYALLKTLAGVVARLRSSQLSVISGQNNAKTNSENWKLKTENFQAEIDELEVIINHCRNLPVTSKGGAFLRVLHQMLQSLKEKGLPQKAVVFTENRESKDYILSILDNTQYNAVDFKDLGSIEQFRQKRNHVLVATDAAGEGFNIEFCNAVFNFDMPWNMQKIEQRIGRCHRIGQKNDVLVFNLLNDENFADVRFYELVYKRVTAFEGILGATDPFLSSPAIGGKTAVADMVATGRNEDETRADFAAMQDEFADEIEGNKKSGDELLFNTFDSAVAQKTKNYAEKLKQMCADTKALLWDFVRYAIKPYGTVNEQKQSIFLHRSVFKSGNIKSLSLQLNEAEGLGRSDLITQTNPVVKELIGQILLDQDNEGSLVLDGTNSEFAGKSGKMGLFDVRLFFHNGTYASRCVLLSDCGFDENDCAKIIKLKAQSTRRANFPDESEWWKEPLERYIERYAESVKIDLNEGLKTEVAIIKRRTANAIATLERQNKELEAQISRLKNTDGQDDFGDSFAKNQRLTELTEKLFKIKQDAFMNKLEIRKHEAAEIAALTQKIGFSTYQSKVFSVQFSVVRGECSVSCGQLSEKARQTLKTDNCKLTTADTKEA